MKDNCPILSQSELSCAPWNQEELEPIEVDCTVCYCMSKTMPISIGNYTYEDGDINLDDTNFIEEYNNDGSTIGIPTLLKELQKLCREKIRNLEDEFNLTNNHNARKKVRKEYEYYKSIINASKDWIVDDLDVCKED